MGRQIRPFKLLVAAAGAAALTVGVGMALAHGGDPSTIHSCVDNKDGKTRIVGAPGFGDPNQGCKNSETPIDWNQTGPPGPPGAAGPTALIKSNGGKVINLTTLIFHTVTPEAAGLSVAVATVHLLDRDPTAGGATGVSCSLGGINGDTSGDVATLVDTGDATHLHNDEATLTLLGRGMLTAGEIVFVGCESFAGDDDEATGFAELLLEHVSS